jgi:acetamidase/formamidase
MPSGGDRARGSAVIHNRWHPDLEPAFHVAPGDEVRLDCEDGLAGQLTRTSTHADAGRLDLGLGHPLTGPVHVAGAEPGDVLEVEFLSYEAPDFGVTAVIPGFGFLADLFGEPYVVSWDLEGGLARSLQLPGVAVPEDTLAGVVGVAPSHELLETIREREAAIAAAGGPVADPLPESALPPEAANGLRTIPPRELGGNLDIRQLVAGSRLLLPVSVPGGAVLRRRPPLRAERRGGLRHGDRDRRRRHRAPEPAPRPALAAALSRLRDPGEAGAALLRHDRHPARRADGPHRGHA